jgi:bacillithiol biosynthesis cysteine-adding enzyme BshC
VTVTYLEDQSAPQRGGLAPRVVSEPADRDGLADVLLQYNRAIGNDDALGNCERLRGAAVAVVTGQQAGLLTGPLYTIYKIITAINLAAAYERTNNQAVVPVFWNATEDHDLSEIAPFYYPEREWRADFPRYGIAAEALPMQPCRTVIDAYLATVDSDRRAAISALIEPDGFDGYGYFSSALIARLFRGTGLVILEPRILRSLGQPFFERAITQAQGVADALAAGAAQMQEAGLMPSFVAGTGSGVFVLDEQGVRRHQRRDNSWDEGALLSLVADRPDRLSTGAYLRPVLQSYLLPVLYCVGGASEIRYQQQLPGLFDLFDITMPDLVERHHATLLTSKEYAVMDRIGLTVIDLMQGASAIYNGIDNGAIDRLFRCVYPRNAAQERRINVFYFIEAAGPDLIGELLDCFDPLEVRHYVIRL